MFVILAVSLTLETIARLIGKVSLPLDYVLWAGCSYAKFYSLFKIFPSTFVFCANVQMLRNEDKMWSSWYLNQIVQILFKIDSSIIFVVTSSKVSLINLTTTTVAHLN